MNERDKVEDDGPSSNDESLTQETERDEVEQVKAISRVETRLLRVGRVAMTTALLATALAVTLTTYKFLVNQENENFETAFEQFSRTVSDAAISQQRRMREALATFTNEIAAFTQSTNATWPRFSMPLFETYAANFRVQAGTEVVSIFNYVKPHERQSYTEWADAAHEDMVKEAHLLSSGNLDRLTADRYHPYISKSLGGGNFVPDEERDDYYFAAWSFSPPPFSHSLINWNVASGFEQELIKSMIQLKSEALVSMVRPYVGAGNAFTQEEHEAMHSKLLDSSTEHPHSFIYAPIHSRADDLDSPIVACFASGFAWDASLRNLLPQGVEGIQVVVKNSCNQSYTYGLVGPYAVFLGDGDLHEREYDQYEKFVELDVSTHPNFTAAPGHCRYSMHIYPSKEFESIYDSTTPEISAGIVAATFFVVAFVFFFYDMVVERRNNKLVENAARSNAIVTSMFPGSMRDQILNYGNKRSQPNRSLSKKRLKDFIENGDSGEGIHGSKPLADLYLQASVVFMDISGFTAWSSVREPSQVFTLLETVYAAFDDVAKKRRVFKVETVGDCYVAVAGLPEKRDDHAVAIARFARDCLATMSKVSQKLEVTLGPDTGDLSIRVGIHSGPVTAGVLRGERARFQLFGDTVNTASRIESKSEPGRIHLSEETAALLIAAGKSHWLTPRETKISAKGKGDLQTYWLNMNRETKEEFEDTLDVALHLEDISNMPDQHQDENGVAGLDERKSRLIDWNVDMLLRLLKQVVARRQATYKRTLAPEASSLPITDDLLTHKADNFLDEVCEIISLPEFDSKAARRQQDPDTIVIPDHVVDQVRDYVTCIATMYRENPFHGFDHASHVVMSVGKLMSRIVAPSDLLEELEELKGEAEDGSTYEKKGGNMNASRKSQTKRKNIVAANLHDHTYGITSDPLTQFACAFSALIHDVDHTGVPNATLVKENAVIAALYKNRSVAEQNSLDLSWDLFMDQRFKDFRSTLIASVDELQRFRQLVVNSVMATDIVDKDLKALRNARWEKAFKKKTSAEGKDSPVGVPVLEIQDARASRDHVNRKATIVIEHLIQASDVSHTMQHWHIYRKWNQKLFLEMFQAFKEGRAEKNPAEFWYQGEIGFFDFYIIPLAKKLKECGVFGISSDEYLDYALRNRQEWEKRGQEVVAEMLEQL